MHISRFTATAAMVIGATAVAGGTAYAQPAQMEPGPARHEPVAGTHPAAVENSDHENGIRYHSRQIDGHRVETTITGGTFVLDTAAGTVGVADRNGKVVATMSTTIPLGDHRVALAPAVDRSGTTMTLMPVDLPAELQHAAPAAIAGLIIGGAAGIFVGALTGAIVGLLGGLLLFVVGAIPGLLLGPLVGGFFGGVMGASTGWNLGNCGGISCPNPPPGPAQPAATPKPAPKRR